MLLTAVLKFYLFAILILSWCASKHLPTFRGNEKGAHYWRFSWEANWRALHTVDIS